MRKRLFLASAVALGALVLLSLTLINNATPAAAQAADAECDIKNAAMIGSLSFGTNCLDGKALQSYVSGKSGIKSNTIKAYAQCPDGSLVMSGVTDLTTFDGKKFGAIKKGDFTSADKIICQAPDKIWVGHFQGVSFYDGKAWKKYDAKENFGTSTGATLIKDMAVAADGKLWVATGGSIAAFDGTKWTLFDKTNGFTSDIFPGTLAIDSKGKVWTNSSNKLFSYDGKAWATVENKDFFTVNALAIDAKDQVWVGTFSQGIYVFDGKAWKTYNRKANGLASNSVKQIAFDKKGRAWVGTAWGLSVLAEGDKFTNINMSNSNLLDNDIYGLAVFGDGGALPKTEAKAPGSVIGVIENGRDAVPGAVVQLCSEPIPSSFRTETPCADMPDMVMAKANDKGEFEIKDVPAGRYNMAIQGADKKWIRFIGLNSKVTVVSGKPTDLDDIDISKTN